MTLRATGQAVFQKLIRVLPLAVLGGGLVSFKSFPYSLLTTSGDGRVLSGIRLATPTRRRRSGF
jgi:hypothetical protein